MTSPTLARGQDQSPASLQDFQEQQMTNEASHQQQQHLAHVPRQSPDVNEQKETNDGLASSSVVSSSSITQRSDNSDRTINKNEEKSSTLTTAATRDEKCLRAEEIPTSSSSNRIIASNDVQNSAGNNNNVVDDDDNGDVLSFNHNISSNATITAFHSISSDVSSPVRRFMPSSVDQQAYADETDESLPTFPSPPLLSSLLMHEQPNHANDKARGEEHSLHTILKSSESQCTPTDPPSSPSKEKKSGLFSPRSLPPHYTESQWFSFLLPRRGEISYTRIENSIRWIIDSDQDELRCRRHCIITSSADNRRAVSRTISYG